tara:strand:+ start:91 stop:651 length:561 start_codon:yes stop_codon:yes gene_type:complete
MSLTTRAKIKQVLGIPTAVTQQDDYIDVLVAVVDTEILGYTGIAALTQTTLTEYYDMTEQYQSEVLLRSFPATSVTYMKVGGTTTSTGDYYLDSEVGVIRLKNLGDYFPTGRQNIEVEYVAGYETVPSDLSYAASLLAASHFNGGRHAGMLYEQVGTYRYRRREGLPDDVVNILARYRRVFARNMF